MFDRIRCWLPVVAVLLIPVPAAPAADKDKPELLPLNATKTVLLDKAGKRILLKTKVVLREGQLEMLVCPKKTKEHESILAIDSKALNVHAGIMALGVKAGSPAKFDPKFTPPKGQELKITLQWKDKAGKSHRVDAQTWIRHATQRYFEQPMKVLPKDLKLPDSQELPLRYDKRTKDLLWYGPMTAAQRDKLLKLSADKNYQKAIKSFYDKTRKRQMKANWIFAGSGFDVHPMTGKRRYLAETGTLICVANFPGATVDIRQRSSANSGSELYEAWTERIPPVGTEVTVEIKPVAPKAKKAKKKGN